MTSCSVAAARQQKQRGQIIATPGLEIVRTLVCAGITTEWELTFSIEDDSGSDSGLHEQLMNPRWK